MLAIQDMSYTGLVGAAIIALLGWTVVVGVYRVLFHPLAKFPGPKLAALTTWYEGYYDVIRYKGRFTFHLEDLHKKYGKQKLLLFL
jgi:hypothetical protein